MVRGAIQNGYVLIKDISYGLDYVESTQPDRTCSHGQERQTKQTKRFTRNTFLRKIFWMQFHIPKHVTVLQGIQILLTF